MFSYSFKFIVVSRLKKNTIKHPFYFLKITHGNQPVFFDMYWGNGDKYRKILKHFRSIPKPIKHKYCFLLVFLVKNP